MTAGIRWIGVGRTEEDSWDKMGRGEGGGEQSRRQHRIKCFGELLLKP